MQEQKAANSTYLYPRRAVQAAVRCKSRAGIERWWSGFELRVQHLGLGAFCLILSKTDRTSTVRAIPVWLVGRAGERWV